MSFIAQIPGVRVAQEKVGQTRARLKGRRAESSQTLCIILNGRDLLGLKGGVGRRCRGLDVGINWYRSESGIYIDFQQF